LQNVLKKAALNRKIEMNQRTPLLLHRDNPDKKPLIGHVKVTAEDWLNVARDVLVSEGVAEVKVINIGERLSVSRSSFYWYFKSRKHLLEKLLDDWEIRNTQRLIENCNLETRNISEAACNFFRCFIDPRLFDRGLDSAIREWSRRDGAVRQRIDLADKTRLTAVANMFERHGFSQYDADIRARIIYFMQLGYHAMEVHEPMLERLNRLEGYLRGFTGEEPEADIVAAFKAFVSSLNAK
jgi:AcrR family transcriptional regulator